jgi:hypothetical protein
MCAVHSNSLDEMRARKRGLKSVGEILRFARDQSFADMMLIA